MVSAGGEEAKIRLFSEYSDVAYQIKGNGACSNMVANILPATPTPNPGCWVKSSKFNFFQNMVLLHIKLKGITNAVTWKQLFCPQSPHTIKKSKFNFEEYSHVAYQIKGNDACSNMVANILPADPHPQLKVMTHAATW